MSKMSELIFSNEKHYITSPYGWRTLNGKHSNHQGVDYGTSNQKLPQYAIESGYIFAAGKATADKALYVWVIYPRIKKAFLHYHLDSYSVRAGQAVNKGTLLGYTGKTGYATGVHLHLGVRDLSRLPDAQIKNMNWALLRTCPYIDAESMPYTELANNPFSEPKRAVTRDFEGEDVKWVQWELVRLGYNIGKAGIDGRCGMITTQAIKDFQKQHKDLNGKQLVADGQAGPLTRGAMKNA